MAVTIEIIDGIAHVHIPQPDRIDTYSREQVIKEINKLEDKKSKKSDDIISVTNQYNRRKTDLENDIIKIDNKLVIANQVLHDIDAG